MLKIIHNPKCSKSRQALQLLEDKNCTFEVIEYLKNPLTKEELTSILNKLGKSPQEILRKGEKIFKENFKGKEYSDAEWIEIMIANPKLIERPIVFNDTKAVVGRPTEDVLKLIQ